MARELNRELFGQRNAREQEPGSAPISAAAAADEVRLLHLHMETLAKRLKDFESRLETLQTKTNEVVAGNKQRFERVQSHFQSQGEMIRNGFADINTKIAQVVSRVNERRVADNVVKEMVDRHSQVVQSFEVRLNQLQRVISEQELQLMNARTELRETLQELARLKKL